MPAVEFTPVLETIVRENGPLMVDRKIVALANGNFAVLSTSSQTAFVSQTESYSYRASTISIYDSSGNFIGNATLSGGPGEIRADADIAAMPDGVLVVSYTSSSYIGRAFTPGDVYLQRFSGPGTGSPPLLVNAAADTPRSASGSAEGSSAITVTSLGDIIVAYQSPSGILVQRMDPIAGRDGAPVKANVNPSLGDTEIVALTNGSYSVTWTASGAGSDIAGRVFGVSGAPIGDEFIVNTATAGDQSRASLASIAGGGFVAVWQSDGDIKGQRFDTVGVKVGPEFSVATIEAGAQTAPKVSPYPGGGFVVTWEDASGANSNIAARVFDNASVPTAAQFQANFTELGNEAVPAVVALADGSLWFAWSVSGSPQIERLGHLVPGAASTRLGTNGNDVVIGDAGNNYLSGLDGVDILMGGDGDDILDGSGTGRGTLDGGNGSDTVSYFSYASFDSPGITVDLVQNRGFDRNAAGDIYISIENVIGGPGNDRLIGNDEANRLYGGGGNDIIITGRGGDTIFGDVGIDTVSYIDSNGTVQVNLTLGRGFNNFADSDTYDGIENVTGSNYNDVLIGDAGSNRLDGGAGDDLLIGALGADVLIGGTGSDTVSYEDSTGAVFVNLTLGRGYNNSAEGDTYTSIEHGIGSRFNDVFIGDARANRLEGLAGNDILIGAMGGDTLVGGEGSDTASYEDNQGAVFVNLTLGRGYNNAADGDTYQGIENLVGGLFDDVFLGDDGNNRLDGAMGADTLYGFGGADTFVFAHAPGGTSAFGSPNVDTIADFVSGTDRIELAKSVFAALGIGTLSAAAFATGTAATTTDQRILYDAATGTLRYDADGSGAGASVVFAVLETKPTIAAGDFFVA